MSIMVLLFFIFFSVIAYGMEQLNDIALIDTYAKIVDFTEQHRLPLTDIQIMYNWMNYGAFSDSDNQCRLSPVPLEVLKKIFYHAHANFMPAPCVVKRTFPDNCINFEITLEKPIADVKLLYEHSTNVMKWLQNKGSIPLRSECCFQHKSNKIYEIALINHDINRSIINKIFFPTMKDQIFHAPPPTFYDPRLIGNTKYQCYIYDQDVSIDQQKNVIKSVPFSASTGYVIRSGKKT